MSDNGAQSCSSRDYRPAAPVLLITPDKRASVRLAPEWSPIRIEVEKQTDTTSAFYERCVSQPETVDRPLAAFLLTIAGPKGISQQ